MKYRRFGRTEIQIPVVSMGGMRFQTSWKRQDDVKNESVVNLRKTVQHALEMGIHHFETARGYGTSEQELAQVLPGLNRDEIIVQTKVGPRESGKDFLSDFYDSLKTLRLDHLDLFAIHGINNPAILENTLKPGGTLEKAVELKEKGVVKWLGFSTHGPVDVILDAIRTNAFDYVNLWYSYIFQDNLAAIEEARSRDMGVFIISPNDKGGKLFEPPEKLCQITDPLHPMEFNDLFILNNPDIHTISCGVSRPSDLDLHAQAVEKMESLAHTVAHIKGRLDKEQADVLGSDWAQDYLQGIPEWEKVPGQINVRVILWLLNLAQAYDMVEYAKMRYNMLGNGGSWFPGKNAGQLQEHADAVRQAVKDSPFADRIVDKLHEAVRVLSGEEVNRLGGGSLMRLTAAVRSIAGQVKGEWRFSGE